MQYDGNAAQGYDAMHTLLRAYMAAPAPKESEGLAQEIVKQKFEGVCSCAGRTGGQAWAGQQDSVAC